MEKNDFSDLDRSRKLILIYNTMRGDYIEYPTHIIPDDFIISTDRSLFTKADAVLFYLPSLNEEIEDELEKPDGQLWIAWRTESEDDYPWVYLPEIAGMFDLWMGNRQYDDIKYPCTHPMLQLCLKVKDKLKEEEQIKREALALGDIFLCSFGDSRFPESRERLVFQTSLFDLFKDIFVYNEHELNDSFRERFKYQLRQEIRGFGYWVWKPHIILECLNKINDNDVLLYIDMGCHLNIRGKKRFLDYWSEIKKCKSGFLVTNLELDDYIEKRWTKGDVFDYFNVRDNPEITHTPQYQASFLFIRKEQQTVDLIKKWLAVFYDDFCLVDDSPSVSPNLDGFNEHRHDQSVFSILIKKHGASSIPINETYNHDWGALEAKYPVLIKRDFRR